MINTAKTAASWPSLLLAICMLLAMPLAFAADAPGRPLQVVGYISDRDPLPVVSAGKLDVLNFAFAKVTAAHEVVLPGPKTAARLQRIADLRRKDPGLKVLLSVGGWGAGHFSEAAATAETRARFARSAVALLRRHDLDGLDIDWEYPAHPGPGIGYSPRDRETFPLLLQALRTALDTLSGTSKRHYLLTIAAADGQAARGLDFARVVPLLDWINLMTYDFYGSLTPQTGHHAGLRPSASAPADGRNTEQAVDAFLRSGVPAPKLYLGMAFYGKRFDDVDPANAGLGQRFHGDVSYVSYGQIRREFMTGGDYKAHWDDQAQAAWLWDARHRRLVSYESPRALRAKVRFAKTRGLGGVMYWEHDQDDGERLLDAVRDALAAPERGAATAP